jgi:hypothetical protein
MIITQNSHATSCVDASFFYLPYGLGMAMGLDSVSSHVVLLPVEPYLVHVYWDVAAADLENAQKNFSPPWTGRPILIIYDVSGRYRDNPRHVFETEVKLHIPKCYVPLSNPTGSYIAELGLRFRNGQFVLLARSNFAHMPRAWPVEPAALSIQERPNQAVRVFPLKTSQKNYRPLFDPSAQNPNVTRNTVETDMSDVTRKRASQVTWMNEAAYAAGISSGQMPTKD